eukprot:351893-Chlamydomonas_euryale.AAC.17
MAYPGLVRQHSARVCKDQLHACNVPWRPRHMITPPRHAHPCINSEWYKVQHIATNLRECSVAIFSKLVAAMCCAYGLVVLSRMAWQVGDHADQQVRSVVHGALLGHTQCGQVQARQARLSAGWHLHVNTSTSIETQHLERLNTPARCTGVRTWPRAEASAVGFPYCPTVRANVYLLKGLQSPHPVIGFCIPERAGPRHVGRGTGAAWTKH